MAPDPAFSRLRSQGFIVTLLGFASLAAAYPWFRALLAPGEGPHWLLLAVLTWGYFSLVLYRNLRENRAGPGGGLRPSLGPANAVTLLRGILMAAFTGLLAVSRPGGHHEPVCCTLVVYFPNYAAEFAGWLPGILYTAAALPDFIDGIIARKTDSASKLGEILDMTVDSVGVLAATSLAAVYGIVPWWYLPIGLARYLFVGGLWIRRLLGLPVHDLPPSIRRRGFAALKMGFMFVVLFPIFGPPGTHIAAAAFGIPFALGFLWDWGLAIGRIRPGTWGPEAPIVRAAVDWAPLLLRAATAILFLPSLQAHLADPGLRLLGAAELVVILFLVLGAAAHTAAIAAAALVGVSQHLAVWGAAGRGPAEVLEGLLGPPLAPGQTWLIPVIVGLIFLGGGRFSIWPIEDRLITSRIGDRGDRE